jgi:hypothetical protein
MSLDRSLKNLTVRLSWLRVFLKTGMDMLVVFRVAYTQSLTNRAETVMGSIILTMHNSTLSRTKQTDCDMEAHIKRRNGTSIVRSKAEEFVESALPSHGVDHSH